MSRTFYHVRSHLDDRPLLDESDYENFETHVIFNDLFIHSDGCSIRGIGPPLVNLSTHLLPMKLDVRSDDGEYADGITARISNHDRVSFFEFCLPKSLQQKKSLQVTLRCSNGFIHQAVAERQSVSSVELQFVTLQKNNPVEWVLDWCSYVEHLGADRVVIYDNGSDNIEALASELALHQSSMTIIVVDWPFAYGPIRSYYNQFCQATQNNHVYQCFASATWVGHFDIDEYLLPANDDCVEKNVLKQFVNRTFSRIGLLRFDSYWVPSIGVKDDSELPTVRDFSFRMRRTRRRAHKYLMRSAAHRMSNTHNGKVKLGFWRQSVSSDSWVFLHYKPLTTNWRFYTVRGATEEFDQELHVEESRIVKYFQSR